MDKENAIFVIMNNIDNMNVINSKVKKEKMSNIVDFASFVEDNSDDGHLLSISIGCFVNN